MWSIKQYFLYTSVCALPILISNAIKYYLTQRLKKLEDPNEGEVCSFTITPKNKHCWRHVINKTSCGEECSYTHLQKIVKRIVDAKTEVLICVNHLTVNDISNALLSVKKRGVSVRCLTDSEMLKVRGSKFPFLKTNGVAIRVNNKGNFHHKFFIVDQNIVCYGSLNLTIQGFTKNFECVVVTKNPRIVNRFKDEFEYLWMNENDY